MNIDKQVTSLELSQKLKEIGVPQDSLFYWSEYWSEGYDKKSNTHIFRRTKKYCVKSYTQFPFNDVAAAFTTGEILEYIYSRTKITIEIYQNDQTYIVMSYGRTQCEDQNLSNAIAKFVIENELIKL